MSEINSKDRFSNRVADYVKFRPSYPAQAVDFLLEKTAVSPQSAVVDIGSGTGKFTRLLLERGLSVLALEPNANMRKAAEQELCRYPGFRSASTGAEDTGLPNCSVDLITAAQSFHWFDQRACKVEFQRILKPGGQVALLWNRREVSPGFMQAYSELIKKWYDNYAAGSAQEHITKLVFDAFFDDCYTAEYFYWEEKHDFKSLWGRSLSNSHAPLAGNPRHKPFHAALWDLFTQYCENGAVRFAYNTEIVVGGWEK